MDKRLHVIQGFDHDLMMMMMMMMMMMIIIIIIIIIITFIQYMNRSHKNGLFKPGEYISTWRIFKAREYLKLAIYIS